MHFNNSNITSQHENLTSPTLEINVCSDSIRRLQLLQRVGDTLQCGFIPSLFLFGTPVNILTMIVFYRQGLRDRMNLCLFCLAFTDLMYVTSLFAMYSSCVIGIVFPDHKNYLGRIFVKYSLNFVNGFSYSSSCLTMIVATERCVCVMFPLHMATFIQTKTMAVVLATAMVLAQLLCGVYAMKEKILIVLDSATGKFLPVLVVTELYLNENFFKVIENIVLPIISLFTFTAVFLATALTVVRLHSALSWRKSTASSYLKGQAVLIRMLVVVSCIYILCTAPNVALALTRFAVPEFRTDGRYCSIFFATHLIGFVIMMLHSSINFFVYAVMSSRFRHHLNLMCLHAKTRMVSRSLLVTSGSIDTKATEPQAS